MAQSGGLQTSHASEPCNQFASVTPDNTNDLTDYRQVRGLYIGTGGSLVVTDWDGNDSTFSNVPNGTILPIRPKKVKTTSTCSGILALK